MKEIRTLIWDCDGLMWFHKPEEAKIISNAMGIIDEDEFKEEFFTMICSFSTEFAQKRVTLNEMYKFVEKKMPILFFYKYTGNDFMKMWSKLKFEINEFNDQVIYVLKYLQNKGIKNIIKSDWWRDVQLPMLYQYGILQYIEEVHFCDFSYLKCNPLSAKEIIASGKEDSYIFIGDSLTSDICFANNAGIKSIWFNRDGRQINETQYTPTYEINSLVKVMDII